MSNFVETTLVDGFAGGPHVTEVQTGLANQGMFGLYDYVLAVGKQAEAKILTNNDIRIYDAVYVIQGRRDVIPFNSYDDVRIENGTQGAYRNDIIVRRYSKNAETGVESTSYAVIKGAANAIKAVDPEIATGDLANGDIIHEMPLYRVKLKGLNITSIEPLFETLYTGDQVKKHLLSLSSSVIAVNKKAMERANEQVREYTDQLKLSDSEYFKIRKQKTLVNIRTGEVHVYMTGSMLQTLASGKGFVLAHLQRLIPEDDMVVPAIVTTNLNNIGSVKAAMYPAGHSSYQGVIRATVINQVSKDNLVYVQVNYFIDPVQLRGMIGDKELSILPLDATIKPQT